MTNELHVGYCGRAYRDADISLRKLTVFKQN